MLEGGNFAIFNKCLSSPNLDPLIRLDDNMAKINDFIQSKKYSNILLILSDIKKLNKVPQEEMNESIINNDNQIVNSDNQIVNNDNQIVNNDNQIVNNDNQIVNNNNQIVNNDNQNSNNEKPLVNKAPSSNHRFTIQNSGPNVDNILFYFHNDSEVSHTNLKKWNDLKSNLNGLSSDFIAFTVDVNMPFNMSLIDKYGISKGDRNLPRIILKTNEGIMAYTNLDFDKISSSICNKFHLVPE
jgi:hypothetical protein